MMEEEFDFESPEERKISVDRYEEMIRNEDQYFFDSKAFEGIIDYYIEINDPIKALHVADYAINQHPFDITFLLKQAQLYSSTQQFDKALHALAKAELLEPSEGDIFFIRGGVYGSRGQFNEAKEQLFQALSLSDNKDEIYFHISVVYQGEGDFEKAIYFL